MGGLSPVHWLILLVVVLLVFGTKKLRGAGKDLGGAVKEFKDAVKDENAAKSIDADAIDSTASETMSNETKEKV